MEYTIEAHNTEYGHILPTEYGHIPYADEAHHTEYRHVIRNLLPRHLIRNIHIVRNMLYTAEAETKVDAV